MKPFAARNDLPRPTQRLRMWVGVLGFLVLGAGVTHAQILSNGLLDDVSVSSQVLATPTGWTVAASKANSGPFNDGASSEAFANFADPGGQGLFFKPFQGSTSDPVTVHLFQDNPGTPGLLYTLNGYAGAEANYSGLIAGTTTQSQFALEFLNAGNTVIGSTVLDLQAIGLGAPNGNPFGYEQFTLSATAPAGTASVRARASMIDAFANPAGGGQAFVVDAFELTSVPEPAAFMLAAFSLVGVAAIRRRR